MSKLKFRGFIPAVTKYVKSKPLAEVVAEVFCYGFLMPLALSGILFIVFMMVTGQFDYSHFDSINCEICY